MKKNVAVYGVGVNCGILDDYMCLDTDSNYDYYDINKSGFNYRGKTIKHPEELDCSFYDYIYVTPHNYKSIVDWLKRDKGIRDEKIKTAHELNIQYITKMLDKVDESVVFFDNPEVDCFRYLFKDMVKENKISLMCLMWENDQWHVEKKYKGKKLFVFGGYDIANHYENGFYEYLKNTYFEAKLALVMWDKWDGICGLRENLPCEITPERIREIFDYCITYHLDDANKYGFHYYPQFYPSYNEHFLTDITETDVFFIGNAKNPKRLALIHNIYKKLIKSGLRCRFFIVGVSSSEQLKNSGIYYNKVLKYEEVVEEIKKTKAILEVCIEGNETSFRLSEAIIFNKKLIVNDQHVVESKYYNKENIQIYKTADDIDSEWFNREMKEYEYDGGLDTEKFIEYLRA